MINGGVPPEDKVGVDHGSDGALLRCLTHMVDPRSRELYSHSLRTESARPLVRHSGCGVLAEPGPQAGDDRGRTASMAADEVPMP